MGYEQKSAKRFDPYLPLCSLYLSFVKTRFQSEAIAWSEVFKRQQWRRISLSQFVALPSREVEGILSSRFSQTEQLYGMLDCAVTGHGKV